MRQTSIFAFHSLTKEKINERQRQVIEALEQIQPATNRQISEYSKIPINVVTPRMGELARKKLVEIDYIGRDVTGRKAVYWKAAA